MRENLKNAMDKDHTQDKEDQVMVLWEELIAERVKVMRKYEKEPKTNYTEDQCICDLSEVNEKYFLKMANVMGKENFKRAYNFYPEETALFV